MKSKYSNTDYGFVVCKLKKGNNDYHPFAYTHKIYNDKLFVPTMHYHGDEKKRLDVELKKRKEYSENGIKNELKSFEFFKKVNGTFFSDEVYKTKLDNIMNKYNKNIELNYRWDHNIFVVNNEHDHKYEKKLDQKMFKKKVNFDIGTISAISKITKNGEYPNGDTIISVKN